MSNKSSDPHTGGDLMDMAATGTKIPNDAGKMNTIPSVPRPDQIASGPDSNYLGSADIETAADNAGDIPRSTRDNAPNEVLTGTGDSLPSTVDSKRLHNVPGGVPNDPQAKGHPRYEKHVRQGAADEVLGAGEGPYAEQTVNPEEGERARDEATEKLERKLV
ncbi:MAG: hypothetical protein Q9160_007490 [Pyrenula sp. 1 TL-2023]